MSQRQRKNHRRKKLAAASSPLDLTHHPDAAGIDVGAEELVVAVPPGRGPAPHVRTFSAFTEGLHALRDWLVKCGLKTVAMESTGNYWLCACALLEDAGLEVCLVNARHVKGVPGKKTDPAGAGPPGSSNSTPPDCCAAASDRTRKSSPCATSCATAATSSRKPGSKCSSCKKSLPK
jgi:hypothetical protein